MEKRVRNLNYSAGVILVDLAKKTTTTRENETGFFIHFSQSSGNASHNWRLGKATDAAMSDQATHFSYSKNSSHFNQQQQRGGSYFLFCFLWRKSCGKMKQQFMQHVWKKTTFLFSVLSPKWHKKRQKIISKQFLEKSWWIHGTKTFVLFFSYRARSTFHAQMFFFFCLLPFSILHIVLLYSNGKKNRRLLLDNWTLLGWVRLFALRLEQQQHGHDNYRSSSQ